MKINIFVEGIEVEGKITHRYASDITVQITKPFSNISTGSHIPYFARSNRSFNGVYGDLTAKSLLKNLYDVGHHMDSEIFSIREKLDSAKESISNLPVQFNSEDFNAKRRELKQSLKQGKFDSKVYQQQLTPLRKKAEEYNQKVIEIMDAFFEDSFPMCVPYGTREEVLGVIEGKKGLVADGVH